MKYKSLCLFILILCYTGLRGEQSWKLYDDSQVAEVRITIDPQALAWVMDPANRYSDSLHLATVHFTNALIDAVVDSVGFRLRGNTSRDARKKSFKLSFNSFVPGRQFYDVDKINLNGEHNDPSIVRSKLCWDFFNEIGLPASRAAHAALYINDAYYGLYVSVEHVDDEFLENNFDDASGNLWKCLYPADLTYHGDDQASYYPENYPDSSPDRPYNLITNRDEYDFRPLVRLIKILNLTPPPIMEDSLEQVIDIAGVLKYLAVNVLTGSWDDYWALMNNYYLFWSKKEGLFRLIPYDYDNTFGISWVSIDWATVNPYTFGRVVDGPRPLATVLMASHRYKNLYTHFLQFYMDNVYNPQLWSQRLGRFKNMLEPWALKDTWRVQDYGFTMNDFRDSYDQSGYSFDPHVRYSIAGFLEKRISSLRGQLRWEESGPAVYQVSHYPQNPNPADSIHITVAAFSPVGLEHVSAVFRNDKNGVRREFPMEFRPLSHSKKIEDHDRWVVSLPPLGIDASAALTIQATDTEGRVLIYPRHQPIRINSTSLLTGPLVINEFLASNSATLADPAGEYDDWLEIYNPGAQAVDLAGLYLSDKRDKLTKWQFPDSTPALDSHDFLLVWCDEDQQQPGIHTNFKLSAAGEFIALTDRDGQTVLDSLSFGTQQTDISFGRLPDGTANWQSMTPTPAAANSATAIGRETVPEKFSLKAFPNPFNSSVVIEFTLPAAEEVRLSVYNALGQVIWQKKTKLLPAGTHRLRWPESGDGQFSGSGLYFVRFQSKSFRTIQKITLVK